MDESSYRSSNKKPDNEPNIDMTATRLICCMAPFQSSVSGTGKGYAVAITMVYKTITTPMASSISNIATSAKVTL